MSRETKFAVDPMTTPELETYLQNESPSKLLHYLVILLDLLALLVYYDLYLVIRHKKHIFTIAFEKKLIA